MNHKRLNPQQVKLQYQLDKIAQAFRQYFAAGDYVAAMKEALKAHKLTPHALAPLSDAATAAVKGSLWDEGIQYAKKVLRLNHKHINAYDALAHAYGGKKDRQIVVKQVYALCSCVMNNMVQGYCLHCL